MYQAIRNVGVRSAKRFVAALGDKQTPPILRKILAPTLPIRTHVAVANLLSQNGDHAAALSELNAVVRRAPRFVQARLMIGQIQAVLGDIEDSIETFEKALEIDPTNANAIESLTQLYSHADRSGQIVAMSRNLQILAPTLPIHTHVTLANLLSQSGDHAAALSELNAIVRRAPRLVQPRLMIGQIQAVLGDTEDSIETFENVLEIDPANANAIESLTQLYSRANLSGQIVAMLRNRPTPLTEAQWRKLGQGLWTASEEARNSSIFTDVEDGCPPFDDVEADYCAAKRADATADADTLSEEAKIQTKIAVLKQLAEKWALQIAAQHSVLGRQEATMARADYGNSQGRMRVLALNLVRRKIKSYPKRSEPPRTIPNDLLSQFTMQAKVESVTAWYDSSLPDVCSDYVCDDHIKGFLAYNKSALPADARERVQAILKDHEPGQGGQARRASSRKIPGDAFQSRKTIPGLKALEGEILAGKRVAVIGEHDSFVESMCVGFGCSVTTVRLRVEGPATLVKLANLAEWLDRTDTYNLIVCRRLIRCWGLGRHGEKLDPDGDVALLAQLKERLAPGGTIATTLPLGRDRLIFNTTRIYGHHRFPHLIGSKSRFAPAKPIGDTELSARRAKATAIRLIPQ